MSMKFRILSLGLAMLAVCRLGQVQAESVIWDIDADNSFIRLNIPDQFIELNEEDGPILAGIREYNPGPFPSAGWSDNGGKRSFVQGQLSTNYVDGTSIEFISGDHSATAIEYGSFLPDPATWDPETETYGPSAGAPAAFNGELALGDPNFPEFGLLVKLGVLSVRNVAYDALGTVSLGSISGGWEGTNPFELGIMPGAWADAESILGNLFMEMLDEQESAENQGSLEIEDLGDGDRRLILTISVPISLTIEGQDLNASITGQIIAYATVSPPTTPPSLVAAKPFHTGFPGGGWAPVDNTKQVIVRGASAQQMGLVNVTSSSKGINGVVLDFEDLEALEDISLEYTWSPQGAFVEGSNPVTGWGSATAPTSTSFHAGEGVGGSNRVRIQWANAAIINRYLRIKVIHDEATIAELYLGNVVGKVTAPSGGLFSVGNADVSAIRVGVGTNVNAGSMLDIDKNSFVNNTDISTMRPGIGVLQLRQITVPAL